jgi:hypothetical protein
MLNLFEQCPACGGPLVITGLKCAHCNLTMQGDFRPPIFAALTADQVTFVRVFLRARGNLSEVEKVLGISYPTIRNKLDEINRVLDRAESQVPEGPATPTASRQSQRLERADDAPPSDPDRESPVTATGTSGRAAILARVASGELDAAQAVELLKALDA